MRTNSPDYSSRVAGIPREYLRLLVLAGPGRCGRKDIPGPPAAFDPEPGHDVDEPPVPGVPRGSRHFGRDLAKVDETGLVEPRVPVRAENRAVAGRRAVEAELLRPQRADQVRLLPDGDVALRVHVGHEAVDDVAARAAGVGDVHAAILGDKYQQVVLGGAFADARGRRSRRRAGGLEGLLDVDRV